MTAINFKKQFAPMVEDGTKTHTIRRRRKNPIKKGDALQLYTGMRTSECRKLRDGICSDVEPIYINPFVEEVIIRDAYLNVSEIEQFAKADGFKSSEDFFQFFNQYPPEVLESEMVLIHWRSP